MKKPLIFVEPIEYYQNLDTTGWKPEEKAIVRSQINIYKQRGDVYFETIRSLQEHYGS